MARFVQGAQITQTTCSPELSGSFEATLALAAGRLDRATPNRPAAICNSLVVHSPRLSGKIVLFPSYHLANRAARRFQPSDLLQYCLFLPVAQLM